MVEKADLPQTAAAFLRVLEPSRLLPAFDESLKVSGVRFALDQQVQMVRHETVRENSELFLLSDAFNFAQHALDDAFVLEHAAARVRANREGILTHTAVVESGNPR